MRKNIWDMVDEILHRLDRIDERLIRLIVDRFERLEDWREEQEREQELKELRLFERIVKMIDERVKGETRPQSES